MTLIPAFVADYPGAIVVPCAVSNQLGPPCEPRGWVLHTPEEPADGYPATPYWFQQEHPDRAGSTHYFVSAKGAVYQCVPEAAAPIANGVLGKPYPAWADARRSLNRQTLSVEIEGYADSIGETLVVGGAQWRALVALIRHRCEAHGIPADRAHIIGHYEVSTDRSDPGAGFPWDRILDELGGEMTPEERARLDNVERQILSARADLNELANGIDAVSVANKWPLSLKGLWWIAGKAWPF